MDFASDAISAFDLDFTGLPKMADNECDKYSDAVDSDVEERLYSLIHHQASNGEANSQTVINIDNDDELPQSASALNFSKTNRTPNCVEYRFNGNVVAEVERSATRRPNTKKSSFVIDKRPDDIKIEDSPNKSVVKNPYVEEIEKAVNKYGRIIDMLLEPVKDKEVPKRNVEVVTISDSDYNSGEETVMESIIRMSKKPPKKDTAPPKVLSKEHVTVDLINSDSDSSSISARSVRTSEQDSDSSDSDVSDTSDESECITPIVKSFKLSNVKGKDRGLSTLLPKDTMRFYNTDSDDSNDVDTSSLSADILDSIPGNNLRFKRIKRNPGEDPRLWKLDIMDLHQNSTAKRYYQTSKYCDHCQKHGNHPTKLCSTPRGEKVCFLCGDRGHQHYMCNKKACTSCLQMGHDSRRCPNRTIHQVCNVCGIQGHSDDYCPNYWRKYCNTTSLNDLSATTITKNKQKSCCNCGGAHFVYRCKFVRNYFHNPFPVTEEGEDNKISNINKNNLKKFDFKSKNRKFKQCKRRKMQPAITTVLDPNFETPKTGKRNRSEAAMDRRRAKKLKKKTMKAKAKYLEKQKKSSTV